MRWESAVVEGDRAEITQATLGGRIALSFVHVREDGEHRADVNMWEDDALALASALLEATDGNHVGKEVVVQFIGRWTVEGAQRRVAEQRARDEREQETR